MVKVAVKGGDIYSTVSGIVENAKVLADPNASPAEKAMAAADIMLDVATGINTRDIKAAGKALEKVKDKIDSMKNVCSFAAGTLVMTRDGLKPIEELGTGDVVLSRNEITGEQTWKTVLGSFIHEHDDILTLSLETADGKAADSILTTGNHPFYVQGKGWTPAAQLKKGDGVITATGMLKVKSATWLQSKQIAYNMEVEDFHTYFVGDGLLALK